MQVVVSADTSPAESALGKLGSGLGGAIGLGVAAIGGAVAAGVAVGVKAAGDLEQAVANISTIKPEIDTSAVFSALNEMSTRIPQTSAQLGESLYNVFSSLDVNAEQGLALVEKFAQGAVGAGTSAETFGTAAMGVMNAYGLSVKDADHISDVFFNTVNKGVITGEELASSLGPVTQSAKSAGVGLDELGAMIAAVTKEGGPAAQNVNNLNNFLQKITTKEAQKQINDLGVATKTATGEFRPTTDVLEDLKVKLGGMTESARANALQAIFPDAQARIGAQTLLSQLDLVKSATEDNRASSGAAAAAYATMSATFNSQSALLMNGLMAILTTIGAMLLPAITPLVTAFSQWLPGAFQATQAALAPVFAALMASLPTIVSLVSGLFALFSGTSTMADMVNVGAILTSIFGPEATTLIMTFVSVAGDAFRAVAEFALQYFGTIVSWVQENWPLIQQTITVVLAAIALLWQEHGQTIITVVQAAWTIVSTVIMTTLQVVLGLIKAAMQIITGDWSGAWDTVKEIVSTVWDVIGTIIGAAWDAIFAILDDASGGALTKITTWMSEIQTAITDGWQTAQDAIAAAWDAITTTIDGAIDAVSSTLDRAWDAITNAVQSAWDGFLSLIQGALDSIQSAIRTVWAQIPEDIRTDLEKIAAALVEKGAAWVESITTTGANMVSAVETWLATLVSDVTTWATSTFLAPIQGLVTSATTEATNVGTGMLASFTAQFTAIVGAVTTWVAEFLAPITALVGTATAAATSVATGILTAITTKLAEVVTAVSSWGSSIVSAISGIAGSVSSAAASIGQGIVNGITNAINAGVGAIRDAAYRAARAALDAAKGALGIQSPSREFRDEVGRMIPAGIIQGVEDMARPLASAMAGMVPTPGAGLSVAPAAGGYAGNTYVIDARGAQVYDGSKFVDMLVSTLEKAERGGRIVKVTR